VQEAGNTGLPDEDVLAFAISKKRAVLTLNRRDFYRLHRLNSRHFGIIACVDDQDRNRMANNIHQEIIHAQSLQGKLIRVYREKPPNI
jgi:hypothetical protein